MAGDSLLGSLMASDDPMEDLLAELRRLRAEGVETVPVSAEAMAILSRVVGHAPAASVATAAVSPRQPAPLDQPRAVAPPPPTTARREPLAAPMPTATKPVIQAPKFDDSAVPEPPVVELPASGPKAGRLAALAESLSASPECRRHLRPGEAPVLGAGSPDAAVLFVGEMPTVSDLASGRLFSGPEAAIVDGALKAMGLSRDTVYITSLMRWRTAGPGGLVDRTPSPRELAYCLPYLRAELSVVRPRVVVALGGTVFHALTGERAKITEARGAWREVDGLPLLPTFHPSYLVKNPSNGPKRQFWEDLLAVMERAGLPVSDRQRGYFR